MLLPAHYRTFYEDPASVCFTSTSTRLASWIAWACRLLPVPPAPVALGNCKVGMAFALGLWLALAFTWTGLGQCYLLPTYFSFENCVFACMRKYIIFLVSTKYIHQVKLFVAAIVVASSTCLCTQRFCARLCLLCLRVLSISFHIRGEQGNAPRPLH